MKIGTRASPLAIKQGELVQQALLQCHPELAERSEIITFSTSGDRFVDRPLSEIGGKGLFTKELEEALLRGDIDIAVHSMKDMATQLPDGLEVIAMLPRDDARDMLVGPYASLEEIPNGAAFGTSSLRRAAQVKILRPDLVILPLRGNVQTRLKKLDQNEVVATMLACAGLKRLELDVPGAVLELSQFLPAVAQGAIGIQCRSDATNLRALLQPIDHVPTHTAVACERAFLKVLDGSCRTPIAGYADISGNTIHLRGLIAKPDGSAHHEATLSGPVADALKIGQEVAKKLLTVAGPDFL
ncbi:MAG: hydroxymethylbilane synthase [Alphaproteobacteria bacterium]